MSFLSALALLVGALVVAPVLAHLLRRGKTEEREFPPAHLVPALLVTSQQRSRLQDLLLLALRAAMVLALAVLGATPLVRCSDLSVDRNEGASVALAIVVDDSQSMRAKTSDGNTRFELAVRGAKQLLDSAREGDVVALIGAGAPARLILNASTDLRAAGKALDELRPTDRSTDVSGAVALARAALAELPHADKRVVLLSDLATRELPQGDPPPWTPLPQLRQAVDNCGIAQAKRTARGVLARVGCSTAEAARGRSLEVRVLGEAKSEPLATSELQPIAGEQKLDLKVDSLGLGLAVRLSGTDALDRDDQAEAGEIEADLVIAVAADTSKASAVTGGPTVVVQALHALDSGLNVHPLGELPEAAEDLKRYAALIVDDPPGLSPEERSALEQWVQQGGVALALLGPSSTSTQLAASVEPFARDGATWEERSPASIATESVAWLGDEAVSLGNLGRTGRVRLDAADLPGATVRGRWEDGVPWLFERPLQRGVLYTVGLPASIELSDFALRPGFLALLDLVVQRGRNHRGPKQSAAGTTWTFPVDTKVEVTAPSGAPLKLGAASTESQHVVPEVTGRYAVKVGDNLEHRLVVLDIDELTLPPQQASDNAVVTQTGGEANLVDASPQWAVLLLGLFAAEMLMRTHGDKLKQRWRAARAARLASK